ncbi:hybrid signal transduction histidine kinase H-like isoform X1 [Daktulosphaira vitifoliae]|uniref:hybrid signal transduction histidine kinase H-like isoform X1 n=1 Tax=Daktulosphaira vitifoliae TaxID=58002 RepID=UPI0021AA5B38|nr:hybrid signal transduction histidine kinase H-like isoform X1 [Daktulosphaira vitifoliae]
MSRYKSPLTFKKSSATVENFSQFKVDEVTPTRDSTATVNTPDNLWISDNTAQPQPVSRQWKGRDFSSPRFSSPRLRDSPYHWSPNNRNNSWNSDFNNSDFNSSFEQNNLSPYNSQVNRHHNRNYKVNGWVTMRALLRWLKSIMFPVQKATETTALNFPRIYHWGKTTRQNL